MISVIPFSFLCASRNVLCVFVNYSCPLLNVSLLSFVCFFFVNSVYLTNLRNIFWKSCNNEKMASDQLLWVCDCDGKIRYFCDDTTWSYVVQLSAKRTKNVTVVCVPFGLEKLTKNVNGFGMLREYELLQNFGKHSIFARPI